MHHAPRRASRSRRHRPHRRSRTRRVLLLAAALALLTGIPSAVASPGPNVPVLRLDGRGHGHGVGLSQWGAHALATSGHDAATILGHYYPGTAIGTAAGEVVVVVADGARALVSLPKGGELRSARGGAQAEGFPIPLAPGEVAAIHHDGTGYRVELGGVRPASSTSPARTFQADCVLLCPPGGEPAPPPDQDEGPALAPEPGDDDEPGDPPPRRGDCPTCAPDDPAPTDAPDGGETSPGAAPPPEAAPQGHAPFSPTPVWAVSAEGGTVRSVDRGRSYRGTLEVVGGPGRVRVRNHVDVEDYLRGLGEVPGTWPAAAVQAQTVAARTYALRAMATGGEICDSESCQVYAGVARENPGQDAAVAATRGWVVTHGGGLAATFYSASAGGHTATVQEGFGSAYDVPYLPARPEPGDPRAWHLEVALRDVGARLDYPGVVTGVRVDATGPSGRPVAMTIEGDAGDRSVDPQVFRRRLGLRSTFFSVQSTTAGTAPAPPPPPVEEDQLVTAEPVEPVAAPLDRPPTELAAPRSLPPADPLAAAELGRGAVLAVAVLALAAASVRRRQHLVRLVPLGPATVLRRSTIRWTGRLAATMVAWTSLRRR